MHFNVFYQTSLLMSLLGEMTTVSGEMHVHGDISYVPQEAWIFTASLRDNILFGQEYDKERYRATLESSALSMVLYFTCLYNYVCKDSEV